MRGQYENRGPGVSRQSSNIGNWIQIIVVIVVLAALFVLGDAWMSRNLAAQFAPAVQGAVQDVQGAVQNAVPAVPQPRVQPPQVPQNPAPAPAEAGQVVQQPAAQPQAPEGRWVTLSDGRSMIGLGGTAYCTPMAYPGHALRAFEQQLRGYRSEGNQAALSMFEC